MNLAKIVANTASVTITYQGEDIAIDYYPGKITGKMLIMMQGLSRTKEEEVGASFGTLCETLAKLVKSWTLYEDMEETIIYPIDADRIGDLPIDLVSQAINAIMEDDRPEARATQLNGKSPH